MFNTGTQVIFGLRHGSTALDDTHRSDAWIDLPLSDEGRQDIVATLADHLKQLSITCIYTPDLLRCTETAHIVKSGLPSDPDIEVKDALKTWNTGSLAGDKKTPTRKAQIIRLIANPSQHAPDGESYNEFISRFDAFMDKQMAEVESGKQKGPVLDIFSGSCCRRVGERLLGDREALDLDEAGLMMLYPDEGGWNVVIVCGGADEHHESS